MRVKLLLLGVAYFLSILDKSHATYKCYQALICIHDGKEKCGQDMTGQTRRFLDSCDMKEYNCLRDTNFQKINHEECRDLYKINNDDDRNKNKVIKNKLKGQFIYDDDKAKGASKEDGVDEESEINTVGGKTKFEKKLKGQFIYADGEAKEVSKEIGVDGASDENTLDGKNKFEKKLKGQFIYDDDDKAKGESKGNVVDGEVTLDGKKKLDDVDGENDEEKVDETGEGNQVTNENEEDGANIIPRAKTTRVKIHPAQAAVINEYWCWRTKYCHRTGGVVCGRDRRLNERRKFKTACDLYNHNCDEGHVFIYILCCINCLPLSNYSNNYDNPVKREKFAQFHCFKLKSCTPGGDKVCGFDETQAFLAEFEDMCTLHKVNCVRKGLFTLVDAPICEGQKKFLSAKRDYDMFDPNLTSVD